MPKTLTNTLSDDLERALAQAANKTNQTAEDTILQLLTQKLALPPTQQAPKSYPLLNLIGCIPTDQIDVADNHDQYISQALYEEMQRGQ